MHLTELGTVKADFHSPISGERDFLRLIVDLGTRTYNKKARSPEKVEVCSTFLRDRQLKPIKRIEVSGSDKSHIGVVTVD